MEINPDSPLLNSSKKKIGTKYGDWSGIVLWGFHDRLKLWLVKCKTSNVEYYKEKHDFCSWTRVDLSELANAPFSNPSNDPQATNFKNFMGDQVKQGFTDMKTVESFIKCFLHLMEPKTNEPFKTVMWPPTKQLKQILVV